MVAWITGVLASVDSLSKSNVRETEEVRFGIETVWSVDGRKWIIAAIW